MRSTANYIGELGLDGRLREDKVLFASDGTAAQQKPEAQVKWVAPMILGFRQLRSERWVATPIYRIKFVGSQAGEGIQRPVRITLERELREELAEYEDKNFPAEEAKKEELRITSAISRNDATVTRSFALVLDTLGAEHGSFLDSYWLDSGILSGI